MLVPGRQGPGRLLAGRSPGPARERRSGGRRVLPVRGPADDPGPALMDADALALRAKTLAREAGFDLVGVARADAPPELASFAAWVARGYAGEMAYLTSQVARRSDLRTPFPWARSLIPVGVQYDTPPAYSVAPPGDRGCIARNAWGDDYHDVLKAMLDRLVDRLREEAGALPARHALAA